MHTNINGYILLWIVPTLLFLTTHELRKHTIPDASALCSAPSIDLTAHPRREEACGYLLNTFFQWRISTTVPTSTIVTIFNRSSLFIRMHPREAGVPSDSGSLVPCMPMPVQGGVASRRNQGP